MKRELAENIIENEKNALMGKSKIFYDHADSTTDTGENMLFSILGDTFEDAANECDSVLDEILHYVEQDRFSFED